MRQVCFMMWCACQQGTLEDGQQMLDNASAGVHISGILRATYNPVLAFAFARMHAIILHDVTTWATSRLCACRSLPCQTQCQNQNVCMDYVGVR